MTLRQRLSYLRGCLWFIRKFGPLRLVRYERLRRSGVTIDYSQVLTPEEMAALPRKLRPWEDYGL